MRACRTVECLFYSTGLQRMLCPSWHPWGQAGEQRRWLVARNMWSRARSLPSKASHLEHTAVKSLM